MNALLAQVDNPEQLKKLDIDQLKILAEEIRAFIIQTVSHTGGHLASNLGVVELSIALHYLLDCPRDKIIWDVGHQCYTHKLLTGRREVFQTLRQIGGISGFPRREESAYDSFNTGHSSTSISAALGMVLARDLKGENYKVVAVIGDGALSNGMAFEAMNHAGHLKKNLIVVLNSNEMTISPSVGALSSYLNRLITTPIYNRFREDVRELLSRVPRVGRRIANLARRIEEGMKNLLVPGALFNELGFSYFGPIDGHDLEVLISTFSKVFNFKGPLIIHVVTKKGKGYRPAEENPEWFHGSAPFHIKTGRPKGKSQITYSQVFGETLVKLAKKDDRIVAITAAMVDGTGLEVFKKAFPERFFDVGIAEEHAVTLAAGLAAEGFKPFVAIYSTFLQRGYDQILHDVCLQNLPVVFAIDRAGLVGEDGPTHHGVFDIAYLYPLPNIVLMAPKDKGELKVMLESALKLEQPVAIRYPRGEAIDIGDSTDVPFGKAEVLLEGSDAAILAVGGMASHALNAAKNLRTKGIEAMVVNVRYLKPIDEALITSLAKTTDCIITIEDHVVDGGFGSAVLQILNSNGISGVKVKRIALPNKFIEHGRREELYEKYGLGRKGIEEAVWRIVREKSEDRIVC